MGNREKLEAFSGVLTQHVAYLADQEPHASIGVLESLLRHLHSLAKSHPSVVATAFRAHLKDVAERRPLDLGPGDFIILTGISTIFPTSDHFHSVVTPACLTIARYLSQSSRIALVNLVKGAYCCTLALQYQRFSKRYVPEVVTYVQQALAALSSTHSNSAESLIRTHVQRPSPLQLSDGEAEPFALLQFEDLYGKPRTSPVDMATNRETPKAITTHNRLKATLISHFLTLLNQAAELWQHKSAFPEIFEPATLLLEDLLRQHDHQTSKRPSPLHTKILTSHTTLTTLTGHTGTNTSVAWPTTPDQRLLLATALSQIHNTEPTRPTLSS